MNAPVPTVPEQATRGPSWIRTASRSFMNPGHIRRETGPGQERRWVAAASLSSQLCYRPWSAPYNQCSGSAAAIAPLGGGSRRRHTRERM
jgi:hypothetical protein